MRSEKMTAQDIEYYMKQYAKTNTGVLMEMSDRLRVECELMQNKRDIMLKTANEIEMAMKGRLAVADIFDAVVSERLKIHTENQEKDLEP